MKQNLITTTAAAALLLTSAVLPVQAYDFNTGRSSLSSRCSTVETDRLIRTAQQKVNIRLATCEREIGDIVRSQKNASADFAEDVTGFIAVGKYVSGGLDEYVREKYEEHFMSERVLAAKVNACVESAMLDVQDIEDNLALELEEVLVTEFGSLSPARAAYIQRSLQDKVRGLSDASVKTGVGISLASQALGRVVEMVAARVVASLATRASISAVALEGSALTWGASLAIGLGVDMAVTAITDPAGKLEEELNKSLDEAAAAMEADFRAGVRNSGLHSLSNRWRSAVEQSIAYSR